MLARGMGAEFLRDFASCLHEDVAVSGASGAFEALPVGP